MIDEKAKLKYKDLNYNSYLKIPELLELQQILSKPPHHDEMFFIIIHQAMELWFKELIHEGKYLAKSLEEESVSFSLKILKRISAIMDLLREQISLLSTLTPIEFEAFRNKLRPASGFQSIQYRQFEFLYGIKDSFFLQFFSKDSEMQKSLKSLMESPTIYDTFLATLSKNGHNIPPEVLKRDFSQQYKSNPKVTQVLKDMYKQAPKNEYHWVLLFEAMVDFDSKAAEWRQTHALMVARVIGRKSGTGGSSGYDFLKKRLEYRFFPELWDLRTELGAY